MHIPVAGNKSSKLIDVFPNKLDYQIVTLSNDGKLGAFASPDGTKFRVIDLQTGNLIQELARGVYSAKITSISLTQITPN